MVTTFIRMYVDKEPEYKNKPLRFKVQSELDAKLCIGRMQKHGNYIRKAWYNDTARNISREICSSNVLL